VQVDPIKPTLKAPASKRLNAKYDKLLSNFGFNFNLRRYNVDIIPGCMRNFDAVSSDWCFPEVRCCNFKPVMEALVLAL